ncbi:MAG: hypothetical protein RIM23_19020 [Coleofasciculus sp. G3-WIS-01]|uniref:hypothetical protein n=1 Tax=Coleofasciculus sp. G3-WIS-01 TaxID=3069528 RepID=UPI0032F60FE3
MIDQSAIASTLTLLEKGRFYGDFAPYIPVSWASILPPFLCEIFPGLWLKQSALLAGDLTKVLEIIQQGIATAEHQMFVKSLSRE